ncbi:MAG TPA: sigma-70 family RNA polymerase sigma factor [Candidatus Acidoferrum sp.]|nr:sigma-70 family RNA polymerase sigma factor [Candidatus Acidoferrum sp.]
MLSNHIDEIDKPGPEIVSPVDPAAEDAVLVVAAKRGNDRAFEILVARHQRRILTVALRFTRLQEDAEDVVQQSFQKAFVHLRKFQGKSSFSTWLTSIVINQARMWLRRSRGAREVSINDSDWNEDTGFRPELSDPGPSPEDNYSQRERTEILCTAIKELTLRTRIAIELRELRELSTRETARLMGLSVGAVKARVFHGRKKLREGLKRYMGAACASERDTSQTLGDARHISQDHVACNACS